MTLVARIQYDYDAENPSEWSQFTLHSWNRKHTSFHDGPPPEGSTVAAWLGYHEHGLCRWFRSSLEATSQDVWDTVPQAGFLLVKEDNWLDGWWDDLTDDEKNEAVDQFLEEYTNWANGSVYMVQIEDPDMGYCTSCAQRLPAKVLVEWCSGIYDTDEYIKDIRRAMNLGDDIEITEVHGE